MPKRGEEKATTPFELSEYKNAILISWRKIFIDRIPLYIIEKLKSNILSANYNAPRELNHKIIDNLTPKNIKLSKQKKEYFSIFYKEKIQKYITETVRNYYKISDNILITSKDVEISNDKVIEEISDAYFSVLTIPGTIVSVFILGITPLLIIPGVVALLSLIIDKFTWWGNKKKIEKFIDDTCKEFIEKINKKEFEDKIRKIIIDNLNKIEKEAILKLPDLSQYQ